MRARCAGRISFPLILGLVIVALALGLIVERSLRSSPVDRARVYRIGFGNDVPLHFADAEGRPTGLAVELVQEAARRKGIKLQWIASTGFNQANMEMWVLQSISPERAKTVHLSEAYLQTEYCFLIPKDSPRRTLADLRDARVSYNNYAVTRNALRRTLPDAEHVQTGDSKQALARVAEGAADAAFLNEYAIVESLLGGGSPTALRILPAHDTRARLALAATFAHAAVADEIRDGMRDMAEANAVMPILEHWAYYPKLATDVITENAVAQRRIRLLIFGLVSLVALILVAGGLAIYSQRRTAQLRRTERLLHQVAARVPGVVFQFRRRPDGTGCFPYASDALEQIFRVTPEQVRHDAAPLFARLSAEELERVRASIRRSAAELTPWTLEFAVRLPEGGERWLFGNALPQRDPDGSVLWHGFISDITERRRAEAALVAFERKLQHTQKLESLGVLAGGIAHDFNNILTAILGHAGLAAAEVPSHSRVQTFLQTIKQSALRAAELCRQMLAYSGRGRFVVKSVALNRLVEETLQLMHHAIGQHAVLRFNLAPALPSIEADATQLRQVIMSLVTNAAEAIGTTNGMIHVNTGVMHADEAFLATTVLGSEASPGDFVYLEISDTGCGMNAETQARIFDPFFTTKFTGRGLGLAAALGIVRGHQGTLKVDSALDRGTTFKVLFPVPAAATAPAPAEPPANPAWSGQGRILLVDDEETVRSTAATMLEMVGFEVTVARDGQEALELFRDAPAPFALVLTDLTMPRMGGRELCERLAQLRPEQRILLMSGFNEHEVISDFGGHAPAGFLQKPFQFDDLREKIRQAIEGA